MPRKVSPPPAIFRIEGLSDGIDRRQVDDWDGKPLETVVRPVPPLPDKPTKRMSAADGRVILQAAGMIERPKVVPKPVAPKVKGKRVSFKGNGIALYADLPPWRRF